MLAVKTPIGAAFHTHHIVAKFHKRKVIAAHPHMRHQSPRESLYPSLNTSNGTRAPSIKPPLTPHQPRLRSSAESNTINSGRIPLLIFVDFIRYSSYHEAINLPTPYKSTKVVNIH
jgi:hypothetical protein